MRNEGRTCDTHTRSVSVFHICFVNGDIRIISILFLFCSFCNHHVIIFFMQVDGFWILSKQMMRIYFGIMRSSSICERCLSSYTSMTLMRFPYFFFLLFIIIPIQSFSPIPPLSKILSIVRIMIHEIIFYSVFLGGGGVQGFWMKCNVFKA